MEINADHGNANVVMIVCKLRMPYFDNNKGTKT